MPKGNRGGHNNGGRAINTNLAQQAKMPDLTGSAKQVAWAEQIRSNALRDIDTVVSGAERDEKVRKQLNVVFNPQTMQDVEAANVLRNTLIGFMQKTTSATDIIDARTGLRAAWLRELAIPEKNIPLTLRTKWDRYLYSNYFGAGG